jgi:hypothetical protein
MVMRSSGCVVSKLVSASVIPSIARIFSSSACESIYSCSMSGPCTIMLSRFVLPPPRPLELEAPEMSVPPDTLMQAFLYFESARRLSRLRRRPGGDSPPAASARQALPPAPCPYSFGVTPRFWNRNA